MGPLGQRGSGSPRTHFPSSKLRPRRGRGRGGRRQQSRAVGPGGGGGRRRPEGPGGGGEVPRRAPRKPWWAAELRAGGRGRVGARRRRRRAADTLFQLGPCVACASCCRSRGRELSTDQPLTLTASAGRRPRRGCAQEQLRNAPSAHSPADRLGLGLIAPRRGARLGRARRRCTAARWLRGSPSPV